MSRHEQFLGFPSFFRSRLMVVATLAALFGGTAIVMLLTTGQMWRLGEMFHPIGWAVDWLKYQDTPFDLVHIVFFAALGAVLRLLLPGVRWWWLMLGLGLLAAGTELSQFGSLDRTPRFEDARDDVIGAAIGLLIASLPKQFADQTPRLLLFVRMLIVGGVVLLPWKTVVAWMPSMHPIHPSHLVFAAALAVRAFTWAGGHAPFRGTRFHLWLLTWLAALGVAWLARWPATWPEWNDTSCPVPPTAWIEASWLWCIGVFLAGLAALVAESCSEQRFARWLLAALILSTVATVLLHGVAPIDPANWRSVVGSLFGFDEAGIAQHASVWVQIALGAFLIVRGVAAAIRGNPVAGVAVAVLLAAAVQAGSPVALGTSVLFWMIVGLLAGTVAHPDAKRARVSQVECH